MKACICLLFAYAIKASAEVAGDRAQTEVTPVQKVIELLEGMSAKGKADKHAEEVQYSAYKQFCDDTSAEKKVSIAEAEQSIESLKASISEATATTELLTKEIGELDAEVAAKEADIAAATKQRETEKADYTKLHLDYSESIDALQRAIVVLKKQAYDRKQSGSLMQLTKLDLIPEEAKNKINVFFAQGEEDLDEDLVAPEANAYEFQSSGIVQMLEKLLNKFVDERTTLEKEEMNGKHSYDMMTMDLKAAIDKATDDKNDKAAFKAKTLEQKAVDEGDLTDTTAAKKSDEAYLADLTATCAEKASSFESRQKLRAEELATIQKAIDIISSAAVSGAADTYLPSLTQTRKAALAQLRANAATNTQRAAGQYLQSQAEKLNSRVLAAIAVRVTDDPFVKVKKMIKDLIVRLMEEANEEAEHKGWCDTELTTNKQTRTEKSDQVSALQVDIDGLTASIEKLSGEITELDKAVAELTVAMTDATKLRQDEKEKNTATIKDAKEAQAAVSKAITMLKLFYEKAGEATALVQKRQTPPEIFEGAYTGMQSLNGGVIGFLEVVMSDFSRLESDTKAAEAAAQKEYDSFMEDSAVDKAAKTTESEHKTKKKTDQTATLTSKKSDLEATQKELDLALAYYDKLKPSCVDAGVKYDVRVGRREEEIQSLQEALKILNGADIA